MNTINDFFNGLAQKIPLAFLQGNFSVFGLDFSKLFVIAAAAVLLVIIVAIIIITAVSARKKKGGISPDLSQLTLGSASASEANSALSETPLKGSGISDNILFKAVATPNCEFELPPEDEQLTAAEQVIDLNQVIIDEMDEKAKAIMLDEFDFDIEIDALCDFDTDVGEENYDEADADDEEEIVPKASGATAEGKKPKARYERSFLAKLIQTESNNKARYNVIKNMFVNYHKVRNSISWNCESFITGKNLIARIYIVGKTLRLCLALNPADYDASIYHHEDKSDTSKYKTVPMMIKIKSRLGLKRAVSLIIDIANKFELKKTSRLEINDYIAAHPYQTDSELLKRELIRKENPNRYKISAPVKEEPASPAADSKEKKAGAKAPGKKTLKTQAAASDATEKTSGKYVFAKKLDGIHFALIANNGQLLLESMNGYSSLAGAKRGIETFKKVVEEGDFMVDDDKFGRFRFILKGKKSMATYSGEAYKSKSAAESSAKSVKRFALTAAIMPFEE